jgi:hypothetical protein
MPPTDPAAPHPDDETSCDTCGDPIAFGAQGWCGVWPDAAVCDGCYGLEVPTSSLCEHGGSRSVCPYGHPTEEAARP